MFDEGHTVLELVQILHRARSWVYKWIERSKSGAEHWYLNDSKVPIKRPKQIDKETEQAIVHSRKHLEKRDTPQTKYAFYGAVGIHRDLDRKGIVDKPSLSTINRVLKRHDLTGKRKTVHREQKKIYFPAPQARHPGFIHQMDMVTPLYITGYGKVNSINRIDVYSSHCNLQQYDAKNVDNVITFLVSDWKTHGIPRFLQVDNEGAFRGGLYHPKTFGRLVRFCINFGVEMIFIPFNEPWRNAHIESLNGRFQKLVWDKNRFHNLEEFRRESAVFCDQHNSYQTYRKDTFSKQPYGGYTQSYLPDNFNYDPEQVLPITTGTVHFIRQVDDNGSIAVLNESFMIDKTLSYEYVWAVVNTRKQKLFVYHKPNKYDAKTLKMEIPYNLREPVKNRIPVSYFLT